MGLFDTLANLVYIGIDMIKQATVVIKGIMARFFQEALNMMNTVVDRLQNRVVGELQGAAHFFRLAGGVFQEGTKNYSIDEELGEWHETVVTRKVGLEQVPESYLPDLYAENEYNDTRELKNALEY